MRPCSATILQDREVERPHIRRRDGVATPSRSSPLCTFPTHKRSRGTCAPVNPSTSLGANGWGEVGQHSPAPQTERALRRAVQPPPERDEDVDQRRHQHRREQTFAIIWPSSSSPIGKTPRKAIVTNSSVSTIWLRMLAIAGAQPQQPAALAALSAAEDRHVERLRDAVGNDPAEPDARRCRPSSSRTPRRSGAMSGEAGSASTSERQQHRSDQRHEAEAHQPVGGGAAVEFGDRARQR